MNNFILARIELTKTICWLYSVLMNCKRLNSPLIFKSLLTLVLLTAGSFCFSGKQGYHQQAGCSDTDAQNDSSLKNSETSAADTEKNSNGVTPSKAPANQQSVWLIAIDLVSSFGKNINHRHYQAPGFARPNLSEYDFNFANFVNTLGEVDTELGNFFTLVGQRPSGTS